MSTRDPYDDDRRNDGYDDHTDPLPGDQDNRHERRRAEALRRVKVPGTIQQLFGAVIIAVEVMLGVLSLISPETIIDVQYDFIEKMQQGQPANQRQQMPPRQEAVDAQRVQGPIYAVLWITAGIFIFIGGSKMKGLHGGYGFAMAGAILSIFPGLCCCCFGLLPGIWSLIVLLNQDVKRSF
jgi:hypothetical protein